jgi:hypothetical protein
LEGGTIAKKTVFLSDLSGKEIEEGKAARITISFDDGRKGTYVLDVTEAEATELGRKGRQQARRGRRPKASSKRVFAPIRISRPLTDMTAAN